MATIAVIGGGFGGTYAIRELLRTKDKILLFEPRPVFVFTPLVHEVAGGVLDLDAVTICYRQLFPKHVTHIRKAATKIDLKQKYLIAGKKYSFDYIIIAPGAATKAAPPGVLTLKSFEDAVHIRARIEESIAKNPSNIIIVGAGPTGVELAGECIDLVKHRCKIEGVKQIPKIILLHTRADILPQLGACSRKAAKRQLKKKGVVLATNAHVNVHNNTVTATVKGKQRHYTGIIIWTAGIAPNRINTPHLKEGPHYHVERTLQVKNHPFAFAIGDAALLPEPEPALAQVAVRQGKLAAQNLRRYQQGKKLKEFGFTSKGMLVSIGQRYGVGNILGIPIKGFLAWFIMRTIYLFKFKNVKQEIVTAIEYTKRLFVCRDKKRIDEHKVLQKYRRKR